MRRSPLALAVAGLAAILAVALLAIAVLGEGQRGGAHGGEEHAGTTTGPAVPPRDVTAGGMRLTVGLSPEEGTVGEVVTITGRVTDQAGAPVRNVRFELVSHHLEDEADVFRTTFVAPDGTFSWGNQFWDGTEHEIRVTASPGPDASAQFPPLVLRREVAVTPVPPPVGVQLQAMVWLLLPVALGLALGIPLGLRRPARRSATARRPAVA